MENFRKRKAWVAKGKIRPKVAARWWGVTSKKKLFKKIHPRVHVSKLAMQVLGQHDGPEDRT